LEDLGAKLNFLAPSVLSRLVFSFERLFVSYNQMQNNQEQVSRRLLIVSSQGATNFFLPFISKLYDYLVCNEDHSMSVDLYYCVALFMLFCDPVTLDTVMGQLFQAFGRESYSCFISQWLNMVVCCVGINSLAMIYYSLMDFLLKNTN
jgi:hypothetical protein